MHTHRVSMILNKVPRKYIKIYHGTNGYTIKSGNKHKCSSIGKLDKLIITHTEWDIVQLFKITVMCFIQWMSKPFSSELI